MLAPLSWLKEYVDIKLSFTDLMWRMTEVGLTCETYHEINGEKVLDVEVTPNRPDWLNIVGIAHEIAAIEGNKIKEPKIKDLPAKKHHLSVSVSVDHSLCPRYTAIVIANVTVKDSPKWLQEKLKLVGLRPINNLVDITNFVMFEMGVPIHVFDFDKFSGSKLIMQRAKGGEEFVSVDGTAYDLPKDAIIIKDEGRVIDLCGLKGGNNTGITEGTKNIFVHVPVYTPAMIRRTSQALKLSSEASYIYERGANAGGTIESLKRVVALILELAGGEVASSLIDFKKEKFEPRLLELSITRLEKILGLKIPDDKVLDIFTSLNLSPKKKADRIICIIPTYRGDLKLEEDLVEEVARIYGYNNFPKTLPVGQTPGAKIPYYFDDSFHLQVKETLAAMGFNEIMSYSLLSEELLKRTKQNPEEHIRLSNPVSLDFEYLRMSLLPNLLGSLKLNPGEKNLKLFELGKVYLGKPEKADEPYFVSGVSRGTAFVEFKGVIDLLLERLNVNGYQINEEIPQGIWHPFKSAEVVIANEAIGSFGQINPFVCENLDIKEEVFAFEFSLSSLQKSAKDKVYKPIPKYPAQIEDITLSFSERTKIGDVIKFVLRITNYVSRIELIDTYGNSYTFRLWYQDPKKTLTDEEVRREREKILKELTQKFGVSI